MNRLRWRGRRRRAAAADREASTAVTRHPWRNRYRVSRPPPGPTSSASPGFSNISAARTSRDHGGSALVIRMKSRQRSEEHTSELQSRLHLVCRLLLEKKKKIHQYDIRSLTDNHN